MSSSCPSPNAASSSSREGDGDDGSNAVLQAAECVAKEETDEDEYVVSPLGEEEPRNNTTNGADAAMPLPISGTQESFNPVKPNAQINDEAEKSRELEILQVSNEMSNDKQQSSRASPLLVEKLAPFGSRHSAFSKHLQAITTHTHTHIVMLFF